MTNSENGLSLYDDESYEVDLDLVSEAEAIRLHLEQLKK